MMHQVWDLEVWDLVEVWDLEVWGLGEVWDLEVWDLVEEQRHPFQGQMDRVGEVVRHHHHHIFHTSPGSFLPSILSIPLPSLYMLPSDGCPSYSKDVDYHTPPHFP